MASPCSVSADSRPLRQIFARNCGQRAKVICLSGATCTGKTSLAKSLEGKLNGSGLRTRLIGQDRFYKTKENVRTLANSEDSSIFFYDYDRTDAVDVHLLMNELDSASEDPELDVLILEGNMLTDLDTAFDRVDCTVFLTIDKENCRQRRLLRTYDPPDNLGHVPVDDIIVAFQHFFCDKIELQHEDLRPEAALQWVSSPSSGANSLFSDTFDGKRVLRLEYEAYQPMARAEISRLCIEVRREVDPSILRIFIGHRIGLVPIGQISVIIAVSAPQRNAAIAASKWLIDGLKERVPIWKKEVYDDGTCSWKENTEQPQLKQ
ncbi:Molybdopterin synthase catalytic subunit [Globodera pallida]|nr:Molybdopterin synthase catalytic subunit [Globodera pallida]